MNLLKIIDKMIPEVDAEPQSVESKLVVEIAETLAAAIGDREIARLVRKVATAAVPHIDSSPQIQNVVRQKLIEIASKIVNAYYKE